MAKFTAWKPDGYTREDKSTEVAYYEKEPVDLALDRVPGGIEIRLCLPGKIATWYAELYLPVAQAEKMKDDIESLLDDLQPTRRIGNDI